MNRKKNITDKEILQKLLNSNKDYELFYFPDSEEEYHNLIEIKVKSKDFSKLKLKLNINYKQLNGNQRSYYILVSILKEYNVPYIEDTIYIDWF